MTLAAIVIRLFGAALIGCLIGINRAHHRYIGVRTLGLVSLGAAAVVCRGCATKSKEPLPSPILGRELRTIIDAIGLQCEPTQGDVVIRGAALSCKTMVLMEACLVA